MCTGQASQASQVRCLLAHFALLYVSGWPQVGLSIVSAALSANALCYGFGLAIDRRPATVDSGPAIVNLHK